MNKIKIFELFAGIGANSKALSNLGLEHEIVGYSELDPDAGKTFATIHGISEELNFGDVTKIDKLPCEIDLLTGGFPCQPFSDAGKGLGIIDKRGLLAMDMVRVAKFNKPKVIIAENVKGILSPKHKPLLDLYISELEKIGYTTWYKLLNSKDFGVAQDRQRVFIVSTLKEKFNFSNLTIKEPKTLGDFLNFEDRDWKPISELTECHRKKLNAFDLEKIFVYDHSESFRFQRKNPRYLNDVCRCLRTNNSFSVYKDGAVSKFTPLEYWLLMGFDKEDYLKAEKINAKTQLYKQGGNSIVVPVLEAIFEELLKEKTIINDNVFEQTNLF